MYSQIWRRPVYCGAVYFHIQYTRIYKRLGSSMLLSSPNKHRPLLQDWCAASVQYLLVLYKFVHFTMQWRVTYKDQAYAKEAFSSLNHLIQLNLSVVLCLLPAVCWLPNDAMQKISLPSLGLLGQIQIDTNTTNKISWCSNALWNRTILGWRFRAHCGHHIMVAQSDWWTTMTKMMMVVTCAHNWTWTNYISL